LPTAARPLLPAAPLRIGEWRVDPALDEIARDGVAVKLEPRTMRLLVALAQRPGELVATEELFATVWPDAIVTSSSVYESVAQLRKALGDRSDEPRYIATVPRKGYRLVAPVSAWQSPQDGAAEPSQADRPSDAIPAEVPTAAPARAAPVAARVAQPAGWPLAGVPAAALRLWGMLGLGLLVALALLVRNLTPAPDIALTTAGSAATDARASAREARPPRVLWVDDRPENNVREREALAAFKVQFDLALSTEEALQRLRGMRYDLIISDMGRPGDPQAGYTLLRALRDRADPTRFILYTSSCNDAQMLEARTRGALGCATQISQLMQMALATLEARP
jgi:DNA-binding winged helix-turn-helix (wHTH) protein/CheY-like chemotaxis protein